MQRDPSTVSSLRFRVFISYSHRDKVWADWLHKTLEPYAIPKRLVGEVTQVGPVPRRLTPIFRDRDELASAHDLGAKDNKALAQSANLIVICSPRSAASRWVDEEVLSFRRLGRGERIFCLVVDGEPNASALPGQSAEECFSPTLRHAVDARGVLTDRPAEPIPADAAFRMSAPAQTSARAGRPPGRESQGHELRAVEPFAQRQRMPQRDAPVLDLGLNGRSGQS
ncbi:toll/interleukin-1 receptor domain-containing protein [Oleiagrimonas sp.]|jgi:hypothetical protein|uniref:toll/interleukin-1 receptor domain-containing protein n=1 Tax=Oleiagrimonas sp. TaxID=2010330 RepID=UPI0026053F20|nr:toll/interleukin-1 receptor domain-containing protein [Oleiagrimonas sp.]MDA3913632.1 toll/interleukin-1 receptor domain-containing protein [Oleiagrimonas sp.]